MGVVVGLNQEKLDLFIRSGRRNFGLVQVERIGILIGAAS